MSSVDFERLINLVGRRISKKDTNYGNYTYHSQCIVGDNVADTIVGDKFQKPFLFLSATHVDDKYFLVWTLLYTYMPLTFAMGSDKIVFHFC